MEKDLILLFSIILSAFLISCAVVFDSSDNETFFPGEESVSLTVEIVCGSGINEVVGTGFITSHNDKLIVLSNSHFVVTNGVENEDIYAIFYNSKISCV